MHWRKKIEEGREGEKEDKFMETRKRKRQRKVRERDQAEKIMQRRKIKG